METIEQKKVERKIVITVPPENERNLIPGNLLLTMLVGVFCGIILIFGLFWGVELLLKI